MRHRVIADNIANVETPGFRRSDVSFGEQLRRALSSSDPDSAEQRIRELQPEIVQDDSSPVGPDGNNVSIDKEMSELTKNNLQYETLVQLLSLKSGMVKTAITEGKR
jgi:flagellar basal-body rod protein FlgB